MRSIVFILNSREVNSIYKITRIIMDHLSRYGYSGKIYYLSDHSLFGNIPYLAKLICTTDTHILHTHTLRAEYVAFIIRFVLMFRGWKLYHITSRHNGFFSEDYRLIFLKNIAFFISCHLVHLNICVSHYVANNLTRIGIPSNRRKVIYNGIELHPVIKDYALHQPPRIIFVGQLIKRKNIFFLLDVLASLKTDFSCTILGTGYLKDQITKYLYTNNLLGKVQIKGYVSDIFPFLTSSDIFVLPSKSEGCSLSLLEAMSVGLPCCVSDCAANKEIIRSNSGLLFRTDNIEMCHKQLTSLLRNSRLRKELGKNAAKEVRSRFAQEMMGKRYCTTYDAILGIPSIPV